MVDWLQSCHFGAVDIGDIRRRWECCCGRLDAELPFYSSAVVHWNVDEDAVWLFEDLVERRAVLKSDKKLHAFRRTWIYRTNFTCCLCGWEIWSLTMRKERGLRVFDYRVLRKIFRRKRDEVTGYWRRLRNEELRDLYSWNIIRKIKSRRMRWAGNVARMGERSVKGSLRKPEGKRTLGRPCRRWNDTIKICRQQIGWWYVDLFDEA